MTSKDSSPTVLLTGGGSGIGLAVLSKLLKNHDFRVAVLTLEPTPELSALENQYEAGRLTVFYGDVCSEGTLNDVVTQTISAFSYLTHFISCIGTMLPVETIANVRMTDFRRIFDVNFFQVASLTQECLPHLQNSASVTGRKPTVIIVTSGVDLNTQYRGWTGYCTSKAALTRFIQLLAHEQPDMHVFGVLPRVTESPMANMIYNGKYDHVMLPEERERFNQFKRDDKFEPPEYIADAIVKAATGKMKRDSPEVVRDVCGALFITSMYQLRDQTA